MRLIAPFAVALVLAAAAVHADKIYSWKDADGNFHFGYAPPSDGQAAPPSGDSGKPSAYQSGADEHARMMERYQKAQSGMSVSNPPQSDAADSRPGRPKEVPMTDQVGGSTQHCKDLAQRISDMPEGKPFKYLSDEILKACPGVAYECRRYRRHPQDNRCVAVRMKDSVVRTLETD